MARSFWAQWTHSGSHVLVRPQRHGRWKCAAVRPAYRVVRSHLPRITRLDRTAAYARRPVFGHRIRATMRGHRRPASAADTPALVIDEAVERILSLARAHADKPHSLLTLQHTVCALSPWVAGLVLARLRGMAGPRPRTSQAAHGDVSSGVLHPAGPPQRDPATQPTLHSSPPTNCSFSVRVHSSSLQKLMRCWSSAAWTALRR